MATLEQIEINIRADVHQAQQNLRNLRQSLLNATNTSQITQFSRQLSALSRDQNSNLRNLNQIIRLRSQSITNSNTQLTNSFRGIDSTNFSNIIGGLGDIGNIVSGLCNLFEILGTIAGKTFSIMENAIKNLVMLGFNFSNELENVKISFESMLGSGKKADKLVDTLAAISSSTPFELSAWTKATRQLLAMGFAVEGIPWVLKNIGDAAASIGEGEEGLYRIARGLSQIYAKGTVSSEEMTQQLGEVLPIWEILADKMGKTTQEVKAMATKGALDAGKTVELLIEGLGERFPGAMEKMSKTWDGLMSTIRDNLKQISALFQTAFKASAMKILFQFSNSLSYLLAVLKQYKNPLLAIEAAIFKAFGQDGINTIMPFLYAVENLYYAVKDLAIELSSLLSPVIIAIMQKLGENVLFVSLVFKGLVDTFMNLSTPLQYLIIGIGVLSGLFVALLPLVIGLAVTIGGVIAAIMSFGVEILAGAGAIAYIIGYIGAFIVALSVLGTALYTAWKNSETFRDIVKQAFSSIYQHIASIIDSIVIIFTQWAGATITLYKAVWPYLVEVVKAWGIGILVVINGVLNFLNGFLQILSGTFTGNWGKVWNGVKTIFGRTFNSIIALGEKAINALLGMVNKAISELNKIKMPDWLPGIGGKGINIPTIGKVKLPRLTWDATPAKGGAGLASLGNLKNAFSGVSDILKNIKSFKLPKVKIEMPDTSKPSKLFKNLTKDLDNLQKAGKNATDKIKEQLEKVNNKIGDFIKSVDNTAKSILDFGNLFEDVVQKKFSGEKLIRALKSQLDYLDTWKQSLSDIGKRIGTNSSLYQTLLQKGPEAAGEIAALSQLSDKKLKEYVGLFGQKENISYEMGYQMEAAKFAEEIRQQQFIINITGNTIKEDYDIDLIANKLIQRLKLEGVY